MDSLPNVQKIPTDSRLYVGLDTPPFRVCLGATSAANLPAKMAPSMLPKNFLSVLSLKSLKSFFQILLSKGFILGQATGLSSHPPR